MQPHSRFSLDLRRLSLMLAALLLAGVSTQARGASGQGLSPGGETCPISLAELQNVDYSQVKMSCVPPPAGSPPPCSACLCDIGRALFSSLNAAGVDVTELAGGSDQAALQGLFQACQMALGAQLVSAAGLDLDLLTQLLVCPVDSITPECVRTQPRIQPEITSFEGQEVTNPSSQPSGSSAEPDANQPTSSPGTNGGPTTSPAAPVPSSTAEDSTAAAPVAVVAAPTPSAPTQQPKTALSGPPRQAAGGAGPEADTVNPSAGPPSGPAAPAASPNSSSGDSKRNSGNESSDIAPAPIETPAIARPGTSSGSNPSRPGGRGGIGENAVMQGGSAVSRASMGWSTIAAPLMVAAAVHVLVGGRH